MSETFEPATSSRPTRLLCVGFRPAFARRLADAVNFYGCWLDSVPEMAALWDRLAAVPYDALIVSYRPPEETLREHLARLRSETSRARRLPILVVAEPADLELAAALLGAGATRILDASRAPHLLHVVLAEVIEVAPRFPIDAPVRLGPPAPFHGSVFAGNPSVARTVNLSATGMLVETQRRDPPGSVLPFELAMPEETEPVSGWAEVIRLAAPPMTGDSGLGLRFRSFAADGGRRYRAYLERLGA